MNNVTVSGYVQSAPEVRTTRRGQRLINFEIAVEGDRGPYVPCAFFLGREEVLQLDPGQRVLIHGSLKHSRGRGLFLAAETIRPLADAPTEIVSSEGAARAAQ